MSIRKSVGDYPPNWPEIAQDVKKGADWKCVRCGHKHDIEAGYMLTVHHMDMNPANCEWWNLLPLCQRCHLQIQHKVVLERMWMFEHSQWFRPYVAGYYASINGRPTAREYVLANLDDLLALGRMWL